jgi:chromosome segregation ATPase
MSPVKPTKNPLKRKSLVEKTLDTFNQKVQHCTQKFHDTRNKEHEKTQKQIKELREDLNKHQSETKDTIKKEIYELKKTTPNIKEELDKVMENFRRKNQTEILEIKSLCSQTKNTVEGYSSRLEQVEDGLSELKDKIEIKEKTEELLFRQLKSCGRNMQGLSNSIKRLSLRIMNNEEGEEVQA